jgi:hypothetical protein
MPDVLKNAQPTPQLAQPPKITAPYVENFLNKGLDILILLGILYLQAWLVSKIIIALMSVRIMVVIEVMIVR